MNQFSRQRRWLGGAIVAFLLVLMLGTASPVFAGTASYSANGTSFGFEADPGERNSVTVRGDAGAIFVKDDGAPITPGPGCVPSGPREVRCMPVVSHCGLAECYASVDLGDGNDRAIVEDRVLGSTTVRGGAGNDRLEGLRGPLNFDGGPGDDTILGSNGDDYLTGGTGADLLQGRGGIDTTGYYDRTQPVTVTLDNKANDGAPGEHDDVRTENVTGGAGADRLVGNDEANLLIGGEGADALEGGGGPDLLSAINYPKSAAEDRDEVRCGDGDDRVEGEPTDRLALDCELAGFGRQPYRAIPVDPLRVRASKAGWIRLTLRRISPPRTVASDDGRLIGDVALHFADGTRRSSLATFALNLHERVTVSLRLNAKTRRRLARARTRRLTLAIVRNVRTERDDAEKPRTAMRLAAAITILAPK